MKANLGLVTKRLEPSTRRLFDMRDVIYDHDWLSKADNIELYYIYRGLCLSRKDSLAMKEYGLRYDITIIPPCMLGREFVKTEGCYHSKVHGTNITYPEIYEVLSGEAHYLMQKSENSRIIDVILVKAEQGDKVVIPPGYGHLTINTSNKVLKMANWVARDFEAIYEPIKEKGGGAYFFLKEGIVKNPHYGEVPEIRMLKPTSIKGLHKSKEIYGIVRDIKKLEFLIKPQEYGWLFEEMFV
ncbi:MAG: glucose-6-phosphate isomerase [Candidatus Methanoperedens sp.]|nr:glucose-6-phosphate isomerase [Candidatus Methanoperedens sp.]